MCSQEPVPRRTLRDFKLPSLFSSRKPWENQDLPSRDFHCLILSRVPWPLCIPYGGKHREMGPGTPQIFSSEVSLQLPIWQYGSIWIHFDQSKSTGISFLYLLRFQQSWHRFFAWTSRASAFFSLCQLGGPDRKDAFSIALVLKVGR